MVLMDLNTGVFRNETLLLETDEDSLIQSIEAIYNSQTRQMLFMIDKEAEDFFIVGKMDDYCVVPYVGSA